MADLIPPSEPFDMVLTRLRVLLENLLETAPPAAQQDLRVYTTASALTPTMQKAGPKSWVRPVRIS